MSEITIVTAFFNIKRENMGVFSRDDSQYLQYFDDWARIQNKIIIFCENKYKDLILETRSKYGLSERTIVHVIDNYQLLDEELYNSINNAMNNDYFKDFMYFNRNPEVINPSYNYLMCIKPYFVKMAIENYALSGTIAWLDFGFNHNLEYYPNNEEFNFLWEYNFDSNYIHLFQLKNIPDIPIFEVIRRMESYIQGGTLIADSKLWPNFWEVIRENMLMLNNTGFADDDQVLYVMLCRRFPNLIRTHNAYWNEAMKLYGGDHLTYVRKKQHPRKFRKLTLLRSRTNRIMRKIKYSYRTFNRLNKGEFDG